MVARERQVPCREDRDDPGGTSAEGQVAAIVARLRAVPPLVTDIDLSLDDQFLYVACWGTGEMRQYDVSEPRKPKLTGSVRIGGIVHRKPHPNGQAYGGGPQMVEISRDGKRVYWTNSLYSTWDNQFYPDGFGRRGHGRSPTPLAVSNWRKTIG